MNVDDLDEFKRSSASAQRAMQAAVDAGVRARMNGARPENIEYITSIAAAQHAHKSKSRDRLPAKVAMFCAGFALGLTLNYPPNPGSVTPSPEASGATKYDEYTRDMLLREIGGRYLTAPNNWPDKLLRLLLVDDDRAQALRKA